jgi:hypothetical protein
MVEVVEVVKAAKAAKVAKGKAAKVAKGKMAKEVRAMTNRRRKVNPGRTTTVALRAADIPSRRPSGGNYRCRTTRSYSCGAPNPPGGDSVPTSDTRATGGTVKTATDGSSNDRYRPPKASARTYDTAFR